MRRHRLWIGWTLGPLTLALFIFTVVAAVTGITPWVPLLVASVLALIATAVIWLVGTKAARRDS
jgi:hypothetical protein